ncbi:MAG TPA: phosphopyruvate hydratase [Candidatus Nanoarchaeia archaeon]|nr:phosphopyruvate hydratase [Candidatus Nanoarchaeia archaeon]
MSKIKSLHAHEIIDSRGNPTLEVNCELESGSLGTASVPSGASTGSFEAHELRDKDANRFNGLGVTRAVKNVVGEIAKKVVTKTLTQESLDELLVDIDGTANKSRLGANSILGVSLSFARAVAQENNIELYEHLGNLIGSNKFKLPEPMFNVINGGKHADSGLDIQEFMIAPVGIESFEKKIQAAAEVIYALRGLFHNRGFSVAVGDEGGFAPRLSSNEEALDFIVRAIKDAGYSTHEIKIALDVAATSFFEHNEYTLKISGLRKSVTTSELLDWYKKLIHQYPIISIEDGFYEEDWSGFKQMNREIGSSVQIVGDDLTVTNTERIEKAIQGEAINSVLIKPNQIGTLTETMHAVMLTTQQGWIPFASHRSGETTDTCIADIAVGFSCGCIKAGSLTRGERVSKYNRLLEIARKI